MKRTFLSIALLSVFLTCNASETIVDSVRHFGLPVVVVETVNHEEPTSEPAYPPEGGMGQGIKNATKVPGRVVVIKAAGDTIFDSGNYVKKQSGMTIKHRGNTSSSVFAKKAYKIKLQSKGDMLGRGETYVDKDWALLKNDYCNLNTLAVLKVCELLGNEWVPAMKYVNVVINGQYRGIYMLSETVERNTDCRINVKKDGYIIESDPYWWNEDLCFDGVLNMGSYKYTFKYPDPEDITDNQLSYIKGAVAELENSIRDGNYDKYMDVNSFVNWLLVHDITGQHDAGGSNRYLTKMDSTTKSLFKMGTPWDFDCAFFAERKNTFAAIHNQFFFEHLFLSQNKTFAKAYVKRWNEIKGTLFSQMNDFLETYKNSDEAKAVDSSWVADDNVWHESWRMIYGKNVQQQIDTLKQWFTQRQTTLDRLISEIDTSPSGIEDVYQHSAYGVYDNRTYNLMGQQVAPDTKGIVIRNGRKYINR